MQRLYACTMAHMCTLPHPPRLHWHVQAWMRVALHV